MPEESLAEKYLKLLEDTTNPGLVLSNFYMELFEQKFNRQFLFQLGRLAKIYGREIVFYALLDLVDMPNLDHSKPLVNLVSYFCKKRLDSKESEYLYLSLVTEIASIEKKIEKIKNQKLKIKNPFEEE